ncbi:UDP-N-acetylmuramoyl-tripeptide--D-alanyl-D-alanine ligase [Urechidicola vernalis]|uniref:UDP-N-acetylmuramoyl-tripeptide--D-alanyl-D-alanine ligase n=1 Tax=Urechidicola vernalis TaxID=3075600 RepID=A0ABU2Y318_9FLAO|nr:UDP-N-acetylmuramoyl-tripeptide--D-alanyl-D-alanine ligase [Urechidicola sp. P050]MDT0552604.1 UDP-N-acetylmuramoyl-tripeptide--D-alanyl-D-alanine ligase [Urechidicola sp. P050]
MTINKLHSLFLKHPTVDTDTRKIRENSIFFALKGENFNGNFFALKALKNGAKYAIVDEDLNTNNEHIINVTDVLKTLQQLATYHRNYLSIPIIGLTGSNGKTTTKELMHAVLHKKYNCTATVGNLNNHIGVPLTLLSMNDETEIGIVEMGANHLKEIELLSDIAQPNYGLITNFGKAHLEGFGGLEGVIKGKSELYNYIKDSKGIVFVNQHDPIQIKQAKGLNQIGIDSSIQLVNSQPFVKVSFEDLQIQSNLIGDYNFNNIALAITIGNYFKVNKNQIKEALETYIPTNNRSQIIKKKSNKIILDAYNANPSSMRVALENFNTLKEQPKIVILGDMFELGTTSNEEHQTISELAENLNFEKIFLVGENFSSIKTRKASNFESFSEFINNIDFSTFKHSTILIKGSRGMALERVLDFL